MIDVDFLKWEGQCPRLMHEFTILIMLEMYLASLTNVDSKKYNLDPE